MLPLRRVAEAGVLVCLVLVSTNAEAQSLTYGAKGGLSLSHVVFTDGFAPDTPSAAGAVAGGFADYRLYGPLSVRGEALFTVETATVLAVQKDTFHTLQVPILVRYRARTVAARPVYIAAGAVIRRVLDATETVAGESSSLKDGVTSSQTGLVIGAGVQLRPRLTLDLRYVQGRGGVYKRVGGATTGRTRSIELTADWRLR